MDENYRARAGVTCFIKQKDPGFKKWESVYEWLLLVEVVWETEIFTIMMTKWAGEASGEGELLGKASGSLWKEKGEKESLWLLWETLMHSR